jgi:hypothetical protein
LTIKHFAAHPASARQWKYADMIFLAFKEKFKDFVVFNLNDIRMIDAGFDRRCLNDWQEKSYIKMVRWAHYAK